MRPNASVAASDNGWWWVICACAMLFDSNAASSSSDSRASGRLRMHAPLPASPFRVWTGKRALGDVTLDAAPAGVADIDRAGAQPARKALGDGARVEAAAFDDRIAQRERHRGVVGHLARLELEPAATEHPVVGAVLAGDLARRHELDGRAERIADRQAEVGAQRTIVQSRAFQVSTIRDRAFQLSTIPDLRGRGIRHRPRSLRTRRRSPGIRPRP